MVYRSRPPSYPTLSEDELRQLATTCRESVRRTIELKLLAIGKRLASMAEAGNVHDLAMERSREELEDLLSGLPTLDMRGEMSFEEQMMISNDFYYNFLASQVTNANSTFNSSGKPRTQLNQEELNAIELIEADSKMMRELGKIRPLYTDFIPENLQDNSNLEQLESNFIVWLDDVSENRVIALNMTRLTNGFISNIVPVVAWSRELPVKPLKSRLEETDNLAQYMYTRYMLPKLNGTNSDPNYTGEIVYDVPKRRLETIKPIYLPHTDIYIPLYSNPDIVPSNNEGRAFVWTKTIYLIDDYNNLLIANVAEGRDGSVDSMAIINYVAKNHMSFDQLILYMKWWAKFLPLIVLNYLLDKRLQKSGFSFLTQAVKIEMSEKAKERAQRALTPDSKGGDNRMLEIRLDNEARELKARPEDDDTSSND